MRNLLALLLACTPDELARIARWWQVDLEGVDLHQDVSRLYRTMTDPWSLALIWDAMSDLERAAVGMLAEAEAEMTAGEAAGRVSALPLGSVNDQVPVLGELTESGWIFSEQPELPTLESSPRSIFVPRELAHLIGRLRDERKLASPLELEPDALLDRLDDQELYEIARQLGYRVVPAVAARQDMLAFLSPRLGDPDAVRERTRMLDPTSARLFTALEAHRGVVYPAKIHEELTPSTPALRRSIRLLASHALLWRGYDDAGRLQLIVPEVILHPRRPPPPEQPALECVDATKV